MFYASTKKTSFIQSRWICLVTFLISLGFLLGSPTFGRKLVLTNIGLTAHDDSSEKYHISYVKKNNQTLL